MQLVNIALIFIVALASVFCAEPKNSERNTLESLPNSFLHSDATRFLRQRGKIYHFELQTKSGSIERHINIEVDKNSKTLSIQQNKGTAVILFRESSSDTFIPTHYFPIKGSLAFKKHGKILSSAGTLLQDKDVIVLLLPMADDMGRKCKVKHIVAAHALSTYESEEDKIEDAVEKCCNKEKIAMAVVQVHFKN